MGGQARHRVKRDQQGTTTVTNKTQSTDFSGVRAKLAAHRAKAGEDHKTETLPQSGVTVTIPGFLNHGQWMRAQRQSGGDVATAQAAFVSEVVRFEGEKLTLADMRELIDAKDMLFLISEIFGDEKPAEGADDDEGGSGNGNPA